MRIAMIMLFCLGSIPCVVMAQRKDSKYKDGVEIAKGMKFGSLNFSTSGKVATNERTPFVYYLDQRKRNISVRFDAGYVFKDNLAAGAGFLYGIKKDYNTQQAADGTITDNKSYERDFAFRPFIKNFLPLGKSKKFYIVIPTELQIGYGSKVNESTTNGVLTRTYTTANYYGVQMRPGILAFIVDNFGFEVNVGAFGLSTSKEKTKSTGQPDAMVRTNDLDLKIDILQLSLGFSLYFR